MHSISARFMRTAAIGVIIAVAAQFGAAAGGAPSDTTSESSSGPEPVVRETHHVTLITGDTARLDVHADGTERATLVPGSGGSPGSHAFVHGGDAYLVPSDAQPLLAADQLDLELFNISDLVEHGFDDQHREHLPLIMSYDTPGARSLGSLPPPDGSTRDAVLPSIGSVAVAVDKDQARGFWTDVTDSLGDTGARSRADLTLTGGLDKIWLDAPIEASLDESAAQIGAPAAWERGYTGAGTTIAVLDSGIDAAHPDFDGRLRGTADFTGSGSPDDHAGHGTHVASIAAGSGAGSDGSYRGIAPAADLLIGKVLGDDGTGTTSMAIAGMEWAANHGADVVNMSLGGPVTNGDDPMSQAVNRLSAEHDVLFVVAAGNYSPWAPEMEFVSSPASAESALAVGGLRTADGLWTGSRRGRMDGDAVKPEIVAPAFGITAAGASGAGLPPYVSNTGTSMAAPHVAGVAALLAQQHPQWGPEELRAALTSTAEPILDYYSTYEQGAGRVDADRATSQEVFVDTGVLHLGYFSRPFDDGELAVSRTLTYRNGSDSPVTLDLSTSLTSGDDDALAVTPSTLTVQPGASAEATVTLDAADLPSDTYSGHVTASSGTLRLSTTVGFYKQDDTVDVTLRALDRNGDPGTATIRITPYKEHDGRYYSEYIYLTPSQPEHTVRLPEGRYNLWSLVTTFDESGRYTEHESIVGDPRLDVQAPNFDVTLDAREAVPVSVRTPRPSEPRSMSMSWWRGDPGSTLFSEETFSWSFYDGEPENVSITPTEEVDDAPFGLVTSFDTGVPALEAHAPETRLDPVQVAGPPVDGRHRLPVIDAGIATPDDLDGLALDGSIALIQESDRLTHAEQTRAAADAGAEMIALYSAHPGVFWPNQVGGSLPVLALPREQGTALAARASSTPVDMHLSGTPRTPYAYDVTFTEHDRIPSRLAYRVLPRDVTEVETSIYTTGTGEHGWRMHQTQDAVCDCDAPAVDDYAPSTGYTRTEYVTARPDLDTISAWQFLFGRPSTVMYSRTGQVYERGAKLEEEWLKAPLSPGIPQSHIRAGGRNPVSRRDGDRLHYSLAAVTDSAGHWTPTFASTSVASRIYREGKQIYDNAWSLSGSTAIPAETATYRLEADVEHDGSLLGLSTHTTSAWTFESTGTGDEQVLPLIDVDYTDVADARTGHSALDLANTAAAGQQVRLELAADHQIGSDAPPVDSMTVQVSYDDGETWADADVTSHEDEFAATYRHSSADDTTGYVSLRVMAEDGAGSRLEQTLVRAYRLATG